MGIKTTLKESDNNKEILDIKLRLERIRNGLNAIKGLPQNSPLLRESLQHDLDMRAAPGGKLEYKKSDGVEMIISQGGVKKEKNSTYEAQVVCHNCGYAGIAELQWGEVIYNNPCPHCGKNHFLEATITKHLQESLDARASEGDGRDIRESAARSSAIDSVIDLRESAYEDNTITFTLSEGSPDDFAGKKIYINKATASEKRERPERSLKDWVATVVESTLEKGKVIVKAFIHDTKLQQLLENAASREAIGIAIDSENLCFVTEGQRLS
jgi:hypothetical protein